MVVKPAAAGDFLKFSGQQRARWVKFTFWKISRAWYSVEA
jgi:hypothetical protein